MNIEHDMIERAKVTIIVLWNFTEFFGESVTEFKKGNIYFFWPNKQYAICHVWHKNSFRKQDC